VDSYIERVSKTKELLIQWLEDFKSKFAQYEIAKPTIDEVEKALKLYALFIGGTQLRVAMNKFLDDKTILKYGLDWQLNKVEQLVLILHMIIECY
jgi:hypothetical protein